MGRLLCFIGRLLKEVWEKFPSASSPLLAARPCGAISEKSPTIELTVRAISEKSPTVDFHHPVHNPLGGLAVTVGIVDHGGAAAG